MRVPVTVFRWLGVAAALLVLAGCQTTRQNYPQTRAIIELPAEYSGIVKDFNFPIVSDIQPFNNIIYSESGTADLHGIDAQYAASPSATLGRMTSMPRW